jgi:hypothetical protein
MSSFKRRESVCAGARRQVCAELETAIQAMSRSAKRDPAAQAGRAVSRARAVAELVGPALPREVYRRDRKRLTAIGKTLGEARAGRRLVARLDTLMKAAGADAGDAAVKSLRKQLAQHRRGALALRTRGQQFDPVVYRLVAELAELRGHVGHWPETDRGPGTDDDTPPPGLAGCYRAARRAADAALADPGKLPAAVSALALLADALDTLTKACPQMLKPQRGLLRDAADAADKVALDPVLLASAGKLEAADLTTALAEASALQWEPATQSVARARHFALAETPQAFVRRVSAYWQAWRGA